MMAGLVALGGGVLVLLVILFGGLGKKPEGLETTIAPYTRKGAGKRVAEPGPQGVTAQAVGIASKALESNRGLEVKLGDKLEAGGMAIKPAEWLLIHAGIAVGATAVAFLISGGSLVFAGVALVLGILVPWMYLGRKQSKRLKAFNSQLAPTLQLMAGSLQAGLSLPQGMDTIVREGAEPMATEFRRALVETRLGVSIEDALESIGERMMSDDFQWCVMAIRIQREVGGNLAELLLQVAGTLRERDYLRRQVKSLSAEGRFSAYILLSLPPVHHALRVLHQPRLPSSAVHDRRRLRDAGRDVHADGPRLLHDEPHDQAGGLMTVTTVLLVARHPRRSSPASSCRSPRSGCSRTRRAASPSRWPSSRPSPPLPRRCKDEMDAGVPGPGPRPASSTASRRSAGG